jgi:hypothetical protein
VLSDNSCQPASSTSRTPPPRKAELARHPRLRDRVPGLRPNSSFSGRQVGVPLPLAKDQPIRRRPDLDRGGEHSRTVMDIARHPGPADLPPRTLPVLTWYFRRSTQPRAEGQAERGPGPRARPPPMPVVDRQVSCAASPCCSAFAIAPPAPAPPAARQWSSGRGTHPSLNESIRPAPRVASVDAHRLSAHVRHPLA